MSSQQGSNQGGNFAVDNLTFDLITILYEKSKGLEAYQKYLKDAQNNQEVARIIQQLIDQDQQAIEQLRPHLAKLLGQQSGATATGGTSKA
jgi:hypothetical protein